jgi:hypothetical protein
MKFVDRTLGEGDEVDAGEAQPFEETSHIFLIA